ncbi:MAG: glycerophosphodiester phosphodiesterase, partial [Clostridia bacterium]|nr:glycerophosphodiester phosphodiesterase [Clostridia bacterium]
AHASGLAVQFWTINDREDIARLVENGADVIITDNPETAYNVIRGEN